MPWIGSTWKFSRCPAPATGRVSASWCETTKSGMRGAQGLAGRIFTAISREKVNVIAIAQGSSELTISIAVRKDGLEKAVRAVHQECKMGEALQYQGDAH